jgi:mannose/cellobiose epimerase-like protein (N-acyl-D-glucosamine 2-epimerase family)
VEIPFMSDTLAPLAAEMMNWLQTSALQLWWIAGADHGRGGFHEALDHDGRPVAANRRARVQARQVYVYATAGDLGWDGPWREAVKHGLDFFLNHYRRHDGFYRTVVSPEGAVVDDAAWLYDQAFALFAMAQATRAGAADLRAQALDLVTALQGWRLSEGGFREPPARYDRQSNPHMHLFEASLAWAAVDDAPVWYALADEIAGLAMSRFVDAQGQLHEFFAPGWAFAEGVDGRIVEPGHQFEWAWLLARWAKLRGREDALQAALKMFAAGKRGVDARRGVATQQLLDDGTVHDDVARLWPQTERIKAAVILGDDAEAALGVAGLKLYLGTEVQGLWWDKLRPDGAFVDEPAPASSFYHIICAIAELRAAAF